MHSSNTRKTRGRRSLGVYCIGMSVFASLLYEMLPKPIFCINSKPFPNLKVKVSLGPLIKLKAFSNTVFFLSRIEGNAEVRLFWKKIFNHSSNVSSQCLPGLLVSYVSVFPLDFFFLAYSMLPKWFLSAAALPFIFPLPLSFLFFLWPAACSVH